MSDINMDDLYNMAKLQKVATDGFREMHEAAEEALATLVPCVMVNEDVELYGAWLKLKSYLAVNKTFIDSLFDGFKDTLDKAEDDIIRGEDMA